MNKNSVFPGVKHLSYYLPTINYSNDLLIKNGKFKERLVSKIGINKKYSSKKNEYSTDLAIKASYKLFKSHPKIKNKINYIIFCSQSPQFNIPSGCSLIQKELFPKKNIPAIDINLGCSGYVYAISLAKSIIQSGEASDVLVLTSDTYSKYISSENFSVSTIFGDGASASYVTDLKNNSINIYKSDSGTDGSHYKSLIVPNSGLNRNTIMINKKKLNTNDLFMDGLQISSFTLAKIPLSINNCLKKNKLTISEIDYFIFHQANKYILEKLRLKIKIPREKFIIDLENKGNTTSSTIPIAMCNLLNKNKNFKNKKILVCGFGVGLSWSTNILRI
tara:strand:+ start:168 stop:1166 length:999 start_codon:yes stop_codon:yes gene_type:complete